MHDALSAALDHFNTHKADHLNDLKNLVRIPSISFPGFDPAPVRQCAEAVAALLRKGGMSDVRILETGAGHPSVFGQWTGAAGKPAVLLYAHHDVQPTGREELWTTPPFEPSERNGRPYGRGTSDDKGGAMTADRRDLFVPEGRRPSSAQCKSDHRRRAIAGKEHRDCNDEP